MCSGPTKHSAAGQAVCSASASSNQSVQLPARRACRQCGDNIIGQRWHTCSASLSAAADVSARQNSCYRFDIINHLTMQNSRTLNTHIDFCNHSFPRFLASSDLKVFSGAQGPAGAMVNQTVTPASLTQPAQVGNITKPVTQMT